jgi:hypothetical protein
MILLVDCAAHPDLLNRTHCKIQNRVVGWVERSDTHQTLMTNYRRNHITGATYFFTVNLAEAILGAYDTRRVGLPAAC